MNLLAVRNIQLLLEKKTGNNNTRPGRVVGKVNNAIRWINCYPVGCLVCFVSIYGVDNDLSSG